MDRIVDEAFLVAETKGVELLWNTVDDYHALFYRHLVPSTSNHQSSMLQDLQRGRRTEIDAINGAIWRYGQQLGIPTPFNEIMTRLIWERERKCREAH
jgi:2-dehydropantoate 2-reductase